MLRQRILTALVGLPVLILGVWFSVESTAALTAIASAIGIYEFCRLSPSAGMRLLIIVGMIGGVLFSVNAAFSENAVLGGGLSGPLFFGAVIAPLLLLVFRPQEERNPSAWAWMVSGLLLIGGTLSLAVLLRRGDHGREWVLTALLLTFAIDTGAYFFGRAFGRKRLAPRISPGKTWEGSFAGVVIGIAVAVILAAAFGLRIHLFQAAILGLIVSIFAQLGDLAESMIKRSAGAKDAGKVVPGHGGMLDRLDSLIPSLAVIYFFLNFLGR